MYDNFDRDILDISSFTGSPFSVLLRSNLHLDILVIVPLVSQLLSSCVVESYFFQIDSQSTEDINYVMTKHI